MNLVQTMQIHFGEMFNYSYSYENEIVAVPKRIVLISSPWVALQIKQCVMTALLGMNSDLNVVCE